MRLHAERDRPFVARRVGQLEVGVEPDRYRHRFLRQVLDPGPHFEDAALQPIGHVDGVGERKLLHPHRLAVELEAARHPRRRVVRLHFDDLPLVGRAEEAVNRDGAADVAERHVERVAAAVGVERLLVEPVRPRAHERNAIEPGLLAEVVDRPVGEAEDVLALDRHLERDVADRGHDADRDLVLRVREPDDVPVLTGGIWLSSALAAPRTSQTASAPEAGPDLSRWSMGTPPGALSACRTGGSYCAGRYFTKDLGPAFRNTEQLPACRNGPGT